MEDHIEHQQEVLRSEERRVGKECHHGGILFTKYAHFCALSHPFKASTVATTFMEEIKKLHGNLKIIVTDRDPIFTGNVWTELFLVWVLK